MCQKCSSMYHLITIKKKYIVSKVNIEQNPANSSMQESYITGLDLHCFSWPMSKCWELYGTFRVGLHSEGESNTHRAQSVGERVDDVVDWQTNKHGSADAINKFTDDILYIICILLSVCIWLFSTIQSFSFSNERTTLKDLFCYFLITSKHFFVAF